MLFWNRYYSPSGHSQSSEEPQRDVRHAGSAAAAGRRTAASIEVRQRLVLTRAEEHHGANHRGHDGQRSIVLLLPCDQGDQTAKTSGERLRTGPPTGAGAASPAKVAMGRPLGFGEK
jgi:hypothetical protein